MSPTEERLVKVIEDCQAVLQEHVLPYSTLKAEEALNRICGFIDNKSLYEFMASIKLDHSGGSALREMYANSQKTIERLKGELWARNHTCRELGESLKAATAKAENWEREFNHSYKKGFEDGRAANGKLINSLETKVAELTAQTVEDVRRIVELEKLPHTAFPGVKVELQTSESPDFADHLRSQESGKPETAPVCKWKMVVGTLEFSFEGPENTSAELWKQAQDLIEHHCKEGRR